MCLEKRLHIKSEALVNFPGNDSSVINVKKKILDRFVVKELSEDNGSIKGRIRGFRNTSYTSNLEDITITFRIDRGKFIGNLKILHMRYDYISKDNKSPDILKVYNIMDELWKITDQSSKYR